MGTDFPERRLAMRADRPHRPRAPHRRRPLAGTARTARRTAAGYCCSTDVTEERRRAAELRLLALAAEQAGDPVEITDADDRFTYVNHAFEASTG